MKELSLGEKLKDLRNKKGLTTVQVCDEIFKRYHYNLSTGKYNEMESDVEKDFGHKAFIYLAEFFEVSTDYLLGLSNAATNDVELSAICNYTGLSKESVLFLHKLKEDNNMIYSQKGVDIISTVLESLSNTIK